MNVLFTDVMTVYNYSRDPETEKESWSRTVVKGVQWTHNKSELAVQTDVKTDNKVERITIDFQRNYGNKPYVSPQQYISAIAEKKAACWTLQNGKDILVLGKCDIEIASVSDIRSLKEQFQYVVTVVAVSDNRSRRFLQNIKVVGK